MQFKKHSLSIWLGGKDYRSSQDTVPTFQEKFIELLFHFFPTDPTSKVQKVKVWWMVVLLTKFCWKGKLKRKIERGSFGFQHWSWSDGRTSPKGCHVGSSRQGTKVLQKQHANKVQDMLPPKYSTVAYWVSYAEGLWKPACAGRAFWPSPEASQETLMGEESSFFTQRKGGGLSLKIRDSGRSLNKQALLSFLCLLHSPHTLCHTVPFWWLSTLHQT